MKPIAAICVIVAAQAQPAFEVASVKPTRPENLLHDGVRFAPGGRFTASSLTLKGLIRFAYAVQGYQIDGGPPWLNADRFDVDTKAEGNPNHEQLLAMLQTMLADRFALKLHRETRELASYRLVVAKSGAKLAAAEPGHTALRIGPALAEWDAGTTTQLANYLADQFGRAVLDRTGLTGRYQIKLEWQPDPNLPVSALILPAVEQLGLKLEPHRDPVEVLVVDHAEKPSPN